MKVYLSSDGIGINKIDFIDDSNDNSGFFDTTCSATSDAASERRIRLSSDKPIKFYFSLNDDYS